MRLSRSKGDLVDDLNSGGAWGRWAILHAMADWRDEDGRQRTKLMPNSLLVARGIALSRKEFLPWFEAPNRDTREMPPGEVAEIHLDNAKIHLYPDDYSPWGSKKRKGELVGRPKDSHQPDVGIRRGAFIKHIGNATKPEVARLIEWLEGERKPEIPKISKTNGDTVERTPPYRPEVRPVGLLWGMLKVGYGHRYEAAGVRGYMGQFLADIVEAELSRIVSHCDQMAESLLAEAPASALDDDLEEDAAGEDALGREDREGGVCEMPEF